MTTTLDGRDAAPGDGICEATPGSGDCTLRAAVDEANATDGQQAVRITLTSDTYTLTLDGADDTNHSGDLDLVADRRVAIEGPANGAKIDAGGFEGGLDVLDGNLQLRRVSVLNASGPGVRVQSGAAGLTRTSIHGNGGPGLEVQTGATAVLVDSTLAANAAGGLDNSGTALALDSTISSNEGGGVTGSGSTHLRGSIVADQVTGADCGGMVLSSGDNVDGDGSCQLTSAGDQPSTDPQLLPLNGATLPARVPVGGSPVVDARPIGSVRCSGTTTDQRGTVRPSGSGCDIGAVEFDGSFSVDTTSDLVDAVPGDGICATSQGSCSLRAAVTEANANPGPDIVRLDVDAVLDRTGPNEDANLTGDLDITDDLQLLGQGRVIDVAGGDRALDVHDALVSLDSVKVTGGNVNGDGGGIRQVGGTLSIIRSTVQDNTADNGGGVSFAGDDLTIDASTFARNAVPEDGDVFSGVGLGGGVYLPQGRAAISRSTFSANRASQGGAIQSGLAFFTNPDTEVELKASTVVDNTGSALDRGFFQYCNVYGCVTYQAGPFTVEATALVNLLGDCSGVTSNGHNLSSDLTCNFAKPGDRRGEDPLLGPLADNGGATYTHLPYANSPLLDAIASADCSASTPADQRGVARPVGPGCDIGAVEGSSSVTALPLTLTVDSAADAPDAAPGDGVCATTSSTCTLRAAVDESNSWPALDRITIGANIDPVLTRPGIDDTNAVGDLDVRTPVTIDGQGATVNGAGLDRVFDVSVNDGVNLVDLTITGGSTNGPGGGIRATGLNLSLLGVTVVGNSASNGGGVSAIFLDADDVSVTDNVATGTGGGIDAGTLVIVGSDLSGNTATGFGGGARVARLTMTDSTVADNRGSSGAGLSVGRYNTNPNSIAGSTITGNQTTGTTFAVDVGWGGGIQMWGPLTVTDTSVIGNQAVSAQNGLGGGISTRGTLVVDRSTIADNRGSSGGGIGQYGDLSLRVSNSTVSANAATAGQAGGIGAASAGGGTATIIATTFRGNTASSLGATLRPVGPMHVSGSVISSAGAACYLDGGTIASGGYNVASDGSCGPAQPTDQVGVDPLLGPLADNGGPTRTHVLLTGSPAIDAIGPGTADLCGPGAVDQRGFARPTGLGCDVGSVEGSASPTLIDLVVSSGSDAPDSFPGDGVCATAASVCTLRAAVTEANARPGSDLITIAPGIDPILSLPGRNDDLNVSGDIDVLEDLRIDGDFSTINAGGLDRAIEARQGAHLTLVNLTITGGDTTGNILGNGAGVWARGGLEMTDVIVTGNTAANGYDGAVTVWSGSLVVRRSTFANNNGSGIELGVASTSVEISTSTMSGNTRVGLDQHGFLPAGSLTMTNSTISGNETGLIWTGSAAIVASTIADNDLGIDTGNVGAGDFTLAGVILDNADDCSGVPVVSAGFNFSNDADCGLTQPTDVSGLVNLLLLTDNGGLTATHMPGAGSVAIDAIPIGTPGLCDGSVPADQRGNSRPGGAACDIGAVEAN